jgi:dienelactone hydrolase
MSLDMGEWIASRVATTPQLSGWELRGSTSLTGWQETLRARVSEALGAMSEWQGVSLNAHSEDFRQMDGYRRERVRFETRPGLEAMGYFLLPDNAPPKVPAILCLPGHGRGVDSIIGIAEDGTQRPLHGPDEYAADYALQCVAQGYAVFALEQISFGHRRDAKARSQGPEASSCHRDSMAALMLGENMIGWRTWDAMCALDYLEMRPEVNPERLGVLGISGGGLTALFTAAMDMRVKAAMVSGYLNTFAGSVLSIQHCVDNYAPALYSLCEMSDIAGLIAPRALFAENGRRDPIFPVASFEKTVTKVAAIYEAFGASDAFQPCVFEGGHEFYGKEAWPFLKRALFD